MLTRLRNSCIFPCHCLALCPSTGWDTSLLFKVFELPLLLDDQRFYAMFPPNPQTRRCAMFLVPFSSIQGLLKRPFWGKGIEKKSAPSIVFIAGFTLYLYRKTTYFDVHPKLRTKEQYYIEYVTGFFLEMCGQQVSSIVWYFERYTSNSLPSSNDWLKFFWMIS